MNSTRDTIMSNQMDSTSDFSIISQPESDRHDALHNQCNGVNGNGIIDSGNDSTPNGSSIDMREIEKSLITMAQSVTAEMSTDELKNRLQEIVRENFHLQENMQQSNAAMRKYAEQMKTWEEQRNEIHEQQISRFVEAKQRLQEENENLKVKMQRMCTANDRNLNGDEPCSSTDIGAFSTVHTDQSACLLENGALKAVIQKMELERTDLLAINNELMTKLEDYQRRDQQDAALRKEEDVKDYSVVVKTGEGDSDVCTANVVDASRGDSEHHQISELLVHMQSEKQQAAKVRMDLMAEKNKVAALMGRISTLEEGKLTTADELYEGSENGSAELREQVASLVEELNTTKQKLKDSQYQCQRLADAERKLAVATQEIEKVCTQSDLDFDCLRLQLANKEAMLAAEQITSQADKLKLAEYATKVRQLENENRTLDRMVKQHSGLTAQQLSQDVNPVIAREQAQHFDKLTAKCLSVTDALQMKDRENQQLQETISLLRVQAETYKDDFEAERSAREKAHDEMQSLQGKLRALQMRHAQLQDRYQNNSKTSQRRSEPPPNYMLPMYDQYGIDVFPPHGAGIDEPDGAVGGKDSSSKEGCHQNVRQEIENCPTCQRHFPDLNTLQQHVLQCLEMDKTS